MRAANTNSNWQLIEIVQTTSDNPNKSLIPLQLFRFAGQEPEANSALWFVSGFEGAAKADAFVMSLLQKAIQKFTFNPAPDIFFTPVANPTAQEKSSRNGSLYPKSPQASFPTSKADKSTTENLCPEVTTLSRWASRIQAKALVTFSYGASRIRFLNTPDDVVQKLSELCEKPAYAFGTEPELRNEDGSIVPRECIDTSFGLWCVEQGLAWIDFSLNAGMKSFEEVAQAEWRCCIGPALKWLVEGLRFNPPKEEPNLPKLQVIPALEMPPEFAALLASL